MLEDLKNAVPALDNVLKHGDSKYGHCAWDNGKSDRENLKDHLEGMGRHLKQYAEGKYIDESGYLTLGHVVARALLALEFGERVRLGRCGDALGSEKWDLDYRCERYFGHREIDGTLHRHGTKEWL